MSETTVIDGKPGKLGAVLLLIGALFYLVSPVDLIPDVVPGLCHLDDLGILGMAVKRALKAFA